MATIVTRAGKGSPLTHNEVDDNFTNLNTAKAEISALAAVATSGSYNDLSNTPAPFDPNTLATVATTGAYSDLISKPTLGTAAATDTTAYATAAQGSLADSALQGNQTITFSGDATGSGTTSIVVTVVDDSHNHIISNVDGLQTALDGKLPLAGGAMTGPITTTSTFDGRDVSVDGTKLDGIAAGANNYSFPYTVSNAAGVNTVVQRDGSGYVHAEFYNGTGTFSTTGAASGMGRFTGTNGLDTYGRSYTAAAARTLLNVADGATNVTNNNQLTNGAGYTTYTANQAVNTTSGPTFLNVTNNGWYYSNGGTGWYNSTYAGGIYMVDASWVRSYNDKGILTGGTMQAGTFNTTSDIKLKENVKTITGALDTVCALRGVTFDWIATKESTLGFIAQEVEKVVPELVSHNVEDDIKTVNYGNMVALLTEAVKELKAEIEELKKR